MWKYIKRLLNENLKDFRDILEFLKYVYFDYPKVTFLIGVFTNLFDHIICCSQQIIIMFLNCCSIKYHVLAE